MFCSHEHIASYRVLEIESTYRGWLLGCSCFACSHCPGHTKSINGRLLHFLASLTAFVCRLYVPMLLLFSRHSCMCQSKNHLGQCASGCRHGFFQLVTVRVISLSLKRCLCKSIVDLLIKQLMYCRYSTMSLSLQRRGIASKLIAHRGIRRRSSMLSNMATQYMTFRWWRR